MTGINLTRNFNREVVDALRHPFDPEYTSLHESHGERYSQALNNNDLMNNPECSTPGIFY